MKLATKFACKSAGFDTLSQRSLAERVEANGREAIGFRAYGSSSPTANDFASALHLSWR